MQYLRIARPARSEVLCGVDRNQNSTNVSAERADRVRPVRSDTPVAHRIAGRTWTRMLAAATGALLITACQDPATSPASTDAVARASASVRPAVATVTWNEVARDLVVRNGTGAAPAIRVYATLSVAQYNAVIAAEKASKGGRRPSVQAAVAGASAEVLSYIYPGETSFLEGKVDEQETSAGWPGDFAAGERIGREVAGRVVERAKGDRFFEPFTGTVPVCPGCWLDVPTPPAFATLGQAKTFFLERGDQFRPPPPPAFGSPEFLADLAEVRDIAATRTPEQDSIAKFWSLQVGTVSPLGYWNIEASELITRYHLNERRAAHTLALMNMAGYDAVVASHEAKYVYWLIRPTQADTSISLAIGLPSFPSYPSNHAAISAAAAMVLGSVFPSERAALAADADEAGISRVYGAIHYRFDSDAGLEMGRRIARYILARDVKGHRPFELK